MQLFIMEAIENAAYVSVGRACGFAGLGLFCVVLGLSFDPALAARTGGAGSLAVALILAFYAWRAPWRPYVRTEVWLILAKDKRPPHSIAQRVIGSTLRRIYSWFAQQAAIIAAVLLATAIVLQLSGVGSMYFTGADHQLRRSLCEERGIDYSPACRKPHSPAATIGGGTLGSGNP